MISTGSKKIKAILAEIQITSYLSYKLYLSDLYQSLKSELENFNHKDFASLLGFSENNNTLRLVITGHRTLSNKAAKIIAASLELKLAERRYFLIMVEFNNERIPNQREKLFADLIRLKSKLCPKVLDSKQLRYFEHWYNPIIREILSLKNLAGRPENIQNALSFPLRLDEIKKSLDLLVEIGAVKYNRRNGCYEKTNEHIVTDNEVDSLSISSYHQRMIEMGKDSLTRIHEDYRSVNAVTVSISRDRVALIKEKINQLLDEVLELEGHCENPSDIYQLNVQLFPFTKEGGK